MARHPNLGITSWQEKSLRKLAAYLMTLPADYPDFEMDDYIGRWDGISSSYAHKAECGTAACAVGHGPRAGIRPKPREWWSNYSERFSGFEEHSPKWEWMFGSDWSEVDNTVHGAAKRIIYLLEMGLPENAEEQRDGKAKLCYLETEVPA